MKRLTKYKPTPNSMFPYKLIDDGANTELDAVHKLGKLEDIEERYGIDLLTLIKAVENGFFYYDYFSNRIAKAESFLSVIDFESSRLIYDECKSFHFEDYGKEWALAKEELR